MSEERYAVRHERIGDALLFFVVIAVILAAVFA